MKTYIKEILQKRKEIPKEEYRLYSEKICDNLNEIEEFIYAKTLLVFYPYLGEVDILPLVKKALEEGKKVYFPKVTSDTTMEFVLVSNMEQFLSGYKGIKEPVGNIIFKKYDRKDDECCMLVPGSIFDEKCNRCGYGKGYYDRYLADVGSITKIGICFSMQMYHEMIPTKPTDIKMDYVVNEDRIIRR